MTPAEIWALCPDCLRWFYCPDWFNTAAPAPLCPVCEAEPTQIENRAIQEDPSVLVDRTPVNASRATDIADP